MIEQENYNKAIEDIRDTLVGFKPGHKIYDDIVASREQVFSRYQPIFSPEHIQNLQKEEFTSFLYTENNRHWSGLYRQGLRAASDLERLKQALSLLLDESRAIEERFPKSLKMVPGFGKAVATAILTVAFPDKYGVWNNTSESALKRAGLWPNFERGDDYGKKYNKINELLKRLCSDLQLDLWTLDALWWAINENNYDGEEDKSEKERFALERHLEDFLLENWNRTPLAKDWKLFNTDEDPEAGNQFPTDIGQIDILAQHKTQPRYLVIELKRNQSTDQTVGQTLRYLGWVRRHLLKEGESAEALIIAHKADKALKYALSAIVDVRMMTYEVEFRLKEMEMFLEK